MSVPGQSGARALEGKIALVTGASRGIGRALAIAFAREGAHLLLVARSEEQLAVVAREIASFGGTARVLAVDVTKATDLGAAVERTAQPGLDVAFINAGISTESATLEQVDADAFRRTFEVNLFGAHNTLRASVPALRRRGGGSIVVVGSGMGHRPAALSGAYATSKAALWMLTRVAAEELAQDGILVNELVPGPVATSIGGGGVPAILALAPQERIKQPEDVVPLALYLATLRGSGPTGQSFSLARRAL